MSRNKEIAVGLRYEMGSSQAPEVAAVGQEKLVKLMKDIARRYGIPSVHASKVAERLCEMQEYGEIPPETYSEVVKLLIEGGKV